MVNGASERQKYSFFHRDFLWFENDSTEIETTVCTCQGKNPDSISVKKFKKISFCFKCLVRALHRTEIHLPADRENLFLIFFSAGK